MSDPRSTSGLAGKRVTVMGLGVLGGGVGVATYLASHGAIVTVTDMRDARMLADSVEALRQLQITFHLGAHEMEDFRAEGADIVVRNPGVPMTSPYLRAAKDDGVCIEMEMSLFFRFCPASILGVTGTKGKTTVSALIGEILRHWRPESLVAGNMGVSAMMELDRLDVSTPVAIELSSFQIEALNEHQLSPHVTVLTNVSEDHLDRYDSFEHYARTKLGLAHAMREHDVVVYNSEDEIVRTVEHQTRARLFPFGLHDPGKDGAWLSDDRMVVRDGTIELTFQRSNVLALSGDHGALNALAATGAAHVYGAPAWAIERGLESFNGVANRLEDVAAVGGVRYVNDTSATAPAAAVAGIRVLAPLALRLHLIAGGADKRTDLAPFADAIQESRAHVYLLDGTATPGLAAMLAERDVMVAGTFGSMDDAVAHAAEASTAGDIVALCPGCASFGMFRNEFDRGEQFRAAVDRKAYAERESGHE